MLRVRLAALVRGSREDAGAVTRVLDQIRSVLTVWRRLSERDLGLASEVEEDSKTIASIRVGAMREASGSSSRVASASAVCGAEPGDVQPRTVSSGVIDLLTPGRPER
jgi:hypothetical protein